MRGGVLALSLLGGACNSPSPPPSPSPSPSRAPAARLVRGWIEQNQLDLSEELLFRRLAGDETTQLWQSHDPDPSLVGLREVGAIVAVRQDGTTSVHCSAVAITPTVIVTAAHCFLPSDCNHEPNPANGAASFRFVQGGDAKDPQSPPYKIVGMSCFSSSACDDVALARLEHALPFDPATEISIGDVDASRTIIKLGYGASLIAGQPTGTAMDAGELEQAEVTPSDVQATKYTYTGKNADGTTVEVCGGDSGGPGLQGATLVGVTSTDSGSSQQHKYVCGPVGTDTRLMGYTTWLHKTVPAMSSVSGNTCH